MLSRFYRTLERTTPAWVKQVIPTRWRIWLGYQIKVKYRPAPPPPRDNHAFRHPLSLPPGSSEDAIYQYLAGFYIPEEGLTPEREGYLRHAFYRFLYTLQLAPAGEGRLLEIGANPYFISLLLRRFTRYALEFTNYFGHDGPVELEQTVVNDREGERVVFRSTSNNLETEPLPFPDRHFDVILCCEVIEHLTNDPCAALTHLKDALKPDGHLILTTPNVARWQSVARLLAGHNIYDDYSAYGPYGRHNREYTPDEMRRLLEHMGFEVEEMFTSDVGPAEMTHLGRYFHLLEPRLPWLGEYMFIRARNVAPAQTKKPAWLYRSYTADEVC